MDFGSVVLGDELRISLEHQALAEGLGKVTPDLCQTDRHRRRNAATDKALSLLVLFDHLIIPGLSGLRIPSLEDKGVIEFAETDAELVLSEELSPRWRDFPQFLPGTDPRLAVEELALLAEQIAPIRPLILGSIPTMGPDDVWQHLARLLRIRRTRLYGTVLDYAHALYSNDVKAVQANLLTEALPEAVIEPLREMLRAPLARRNDESLDAVSGLIVSLDLSLLEFQKLRVISEKFKAGVATLRYGSSGRSQGWQPLGDWHRDPLAAVRVFGLVRSAFTEEGSYWPEIRSIEHALYLRRDPNIVAFRDQLRLFHQYLELGDGDAVTRLRGEVRKAQKALARVSNVEKVLRWVTYLSLPVAAIESLVGTPPAAGTSLAVLSATGTAWTGHAKEGNKWVLFGR